MAVKSSAEWVLERAQLVSISQPAIGAAVAGLDPTTLRALARPAAIFDRQLHLFDPERPDLTVQACWWCWRVCWSARGSCSSIWTGAGCHASTISRGPCLHPSRALRATRSRSLPNPCVQAMLVVDALNFCFWPEEGLEYEHLASGVKAAALADPGLLTAASLAAADAALVQRLFGCPGAVPLEQQRIAGEGWRARGVAKRWGWQG